MARGFLLLLLLVGLASPASAEDVQVHAASSLSDVIEALAERHRRAGQPRPRLAFAASSRIARQVEEGAPAHIIILADEAWGDVLQRGGHVAEGQVLLTNRLVVGVPRGRMPADPSADWLTALRGAKRIAVAGAAVPAGRRAREALTQSGLLAELEPRLVQAPNVRAALALVARGEVDAGIVYSTDAQASAEVEVTHVFDAADHQPIRYPLLLTPAGTRSPAARAFFELLRGAHARPLFSAAGFGFPDSAADFAFASDYAAVAPTHDWVGPLLRSLWVAALSTIIIAVPAVLLGWLLARRSFPGKALLSTALLTPLVLPPVVTGYLLLWVFGRNGPFGALGLELAFTRWGAVIAAAVVGFPLFIVMTRAAIDAVDPRYEQLAETLGLHPLRAFLKVTLPMALPGVAAGAVLAFARALGEFGATAILASDVPGETRTLALAVFALYEQPGGEGAARVLVWISLGLCLVALVGYERLTKAQSRWSAE